MAGNSPESPVVEGKSGGHTTQDGSRADKARGLVKRNVYWAAGLGLIPVPIVDVLALAGVQVKMLKELSDLYGVNFHEDKARTIVVSLFTGLGSVGIAKVVARSLFRLVPVVGQLVGAVGTAVVAGALTMAMGNLFVMHFESGGTLLDFDVDKMRDHFKHEFEKAQKTVSQMQSESKSTGAEPAAP